MIATIAAALLLTLGISGLIGMNLFAHRPSPGANSGITPPLGGPPPVAPLSAGMHFVFLRDGILWSILADGSSKQPDRLTSMGVTVAGGWAVSAPLPGRSAGDIVAYIDLQKGIVHIIRSDGQQDTPVKQPLLKAGVQPMSVWDTSVGTTILSSLSWSSDGNTLAFVADPDGTGQTRLCLYSRETGKVDQVAVPMKGSVSRLVWSPDGIRLAFEVTSNGATAILDYNTQNHGVLTIASGIGTQATAGDSVLSLDWSPNINFPAITWSVGTIGHMHSLWLHRVGIDGTATAHQLLSGDFVQAIYSRAGHNGVGSWLVMAPFAGRPGDLWRVDVSTGTAPVQLTNNRQISFAAWSPDGAHIAYLDMLSAGVGILHIVNTTTAFDVRISDGVANDPAPAWSANGAQLAYSTGTRVGVVNLAAGNANRFLSIKGAASSLTWSVSDPHQLVIALDDGQQGIFLADTRSTSTTRVDTLGTSGPVLWTEIP